MKTRRTWLAVVLLASAIGCKQDLPSEPEPRYQGRTATNWIEQLRDHDEYRRAEAAVALEVIGVPAIPYLRKEIDSNGPASIRATQVVRAIEERERLKKMWTTSTEGASLPPWK